MIPQEINETIAGIDYHLRRVDELSGKLREIKTYLQQLLTIQQNSYLAEFEKMRAQIDFLSQELQKRGLPVAAQYEATYQAMKSQSESVGWPQAVDPEMICDTPPKAAERASHILSMIVSESLKGRRFLDYGCGEGYVVADAIQRGAMAQGYDLDTDQSKVGNIVTSYFENIKANGPYDVILAHDVLDHILKIDPVQALLEMKSVLGIDGKIYVRCHPWSSRHGGHLYTQKAFLHLVMDEVELMRYGGFKSEYNVRVVRPLETYRHWFEAAGLTVVSEIPNITEVEDYYFNPSPVRDRILKHWDGDELAARMNMKIDFVECVLKHSPSDA